MSDDQLRREVLDSCLALGAKGMGGVIGGHVSARVPGEDRFWTNVLDRSFEEMILEDIVLLDFDGKVLDGGRGVSPGIGFHPGIYQKRSDLNAVVHTHGFWITAQSCFARPPKMWHNLCTYFYGRTAVAPDDTLESIAASIGPDDVAIVIPWHGAITAGVDLPEAVALHATFDYTARLDVTMASTGADPLPEESCEKMRALVQTADYLNHTYDQMMRQAGVDRSAVAGRVTVGASA